ncbi:MAG: MEDS domain-containing protein [Nitrospirae bacterium]|nr:MEDS domain-containing protein [Nitrospirota bacterium]
MHTLRSDKRKSGISLIGDLQWGSHFCQFYQTKKDLLDIFVPYFTAGLKNNELCVFITSRALGAEDAKKALKKTLPHFELYAKNGQMQLVPFSRCHEIKGQGAGGKVIASLLDSAISKGFDGLRIACSFQNKNGGKPLTCFGIDTINKYNALAAFAYPRNRFDAIGLMEVVKNHRFALVKNSGRWEVLESSEARTVKDALKRSEEKLHSLFSNMSEGFAYHKIVLDAKGKPCDYIFLEVNRSFERLTGLKGKDVIGKKVTEAMPGIEKDPTDWIGKYGKVALTGRPMQFESYSESLKKWYSVSAFSPHKGYFAVTFTDITGRRQAEEAITRLASFPRLNPNPVLEVNQAGEITFLNEAAISALRAMGLGENDAALLLPQDVGQIFGALRDKQRKIFYRDIKIKNTIFAESIYVAPEFNSIRIYAMNITERKKAEDELNQRTAELEAANRELEAFSYSVSHDLRAPLRSISGFSQALSEDYAGRLDAEGKDSLERIRGAAQRMGQLIDDLLNLSRVTRAGINREKVDLSNLALNIADTLRKTQPSRNAEFIIAEGLFAYGDGRLFNVMLENLLNNAWKFAGKRTHTVIEFGVTKHEGKRAYFVKDNGVGFDKNFADKLFSPFQRLHSPVEFPGTGIGLATVKRIIERHGGRVWIEGEIDKGTTVYFSL